VPKYKAKIELESGAVKYDYGKGAIKERASKKLHQCQVVSDNIDKIINRVITDSKRCIDEALAIGIMLCTYERIGNDWSAEDGHYGVTNLEGRHFTDKKASVTIDYIGKSGVKQHKEIYDPVIVNAIRLKLARCHPNARLLFCTPQACNEYLRPFGCTSKDIRTFAANRLMAQELGKSEDILGYDWKSRKQRGQVFYDAVGSVSKDLGHKPKTLISMYLTKVLVSNYFKNGTIKENPSRSITRENPSNVNTPIGGISMEYDIDESLLHLYELITNSGISCEIEEKSVIAYPNINITIEVKSTDHGFRVTIIGVTGSDSEYITKSSDVVKLLKSKV
jgi:hypothetical protein